MSRVLFIRVSAKTYDEADVPKSWPMLYAALWPDSSLAGVDSPAKLARKLVPANDRGVLELADGIVEYVHFGAIPAERAAGLKPGANTLEKLRRELDEALGNRDVARAQKLCDNIEEALDGLERALRGA